MDRIRHIESLDEPALRPYRTLRRPQEHLREGIFVAEGEKVVRRLLRSDLAIVSMLLTPEWYDLLFAENAPEAVPAQPSPPLIFLAEKNLLERVVGFNLHQGIMAVAKIPAERPLSSILASTSPPFLLVALDGLVNSENIGVIVRNCGAFGVHAIIVGETSGSPYLRRAVRNSMGAIFRLPVVHVTDLAATLCDISRRHSVDIIGALPHEPAPLAGCNLRNSVCLVFGNEGEGISPPVRAICTSHAAIPMFNGTDSLNVANATAVFLYEVRRQRSSDRES